MKTAYPIILTPAQCGYVVSVPDLQINTQGSDVTNAIEMARDAIGIWGICEEDAGRTIPEPSATYPEHASNEIATMVDIDFSAYRRANDNRSIRKNLTLPAWLADKAEQAGINFSAVLQEALKERLNVQ